MRTCAPDDVILLFRLIPHSFDDALYSPHFFLDHNSMNVEMSKILDKFGLNVSLWYPACDPSTADNGYGGCTTGDFNNATVMASKIHYHNTLAYSNLRT